MVAHTIIGVLGLAPGQGISTAMFGSGSSCSFTSHFHKG